MDNNEEMAQAQFIPDPSVKTDSLGFLYVETVPENAFRCRSYLEFYRLKQRKRKHSRENVEMNEGCFYLIKAGRSEIYYVREITCFTCPLDLKEQIGKGDIFLLYSGEIAEEIRKSVELSKLSYSLFIQRGEAAMAEDLANDMYYWGTGKVTHLTQAKDVINNIKKF